MASPAIRKIVLRSSDGEAFEVDEAVAVQMETIRPVVEKDAEDQDIPLINVTGRVLSKVIDYCRLAAGNPAAVADSDADFFDVDQGTLFELILAANQAANYLDIRGLLDMTTRKVADMIKGKTAGGIRKFFKIGPSMTEEEGQELDEAMRRES